MTAREAEWLGVLGQLRAEIGEDAFRSWLRPMNLEHVDSGQAVIAAPTRFLRDWVATHYADRLLALWRGGEGPRKRPPRLRGRAPRPRNCQPFPRSQDETENPPPPPPSPPPP